ncbi:TPA: glycosyltransferase [Bacillus cereus]|nr:glycosyltransferase [Bacillus cereus]
MPISIFDHKETLMKYNEEILEGYKLVKASNVFVNDTFAVEKVEVLRENIQNLYENKVFPKITCCILTFNEERCIERCISSIHQEVDEVVVLDSGSTDRTLEIIKEKFPNVKIVSLEWQNDFAYQRNYVLNHTSHDWVLFLDADEYLFERDRGKIKSVIRFATIFEDKEFCISPFIRNTDGHTYNDTKRIFNKRANIRYYGKVHEEPLTGDKNIPSHMIVDITFLHDGYELDVVQNKNKFKRNISLIEDMVIKEPNNYKWKFFLGREKYANGNIEEFPESIDILVDVINYYFELDEPSPKYLCESLVIVCNAYLSMGYIDKLQEYLEILRSKFPNCSDIYYFDLIINLLICKKSTYNFIQKIEKEVIGNDIGVSYINSTNSHLYSLLVLSLLGMGENKRALEIYCKENLSEKNPELRDQLKDTFYQLKKTLGIS